VPSDASGAQAPAPSELARRPRPFAQPPVDARDLFDPPPARRVFERQDVVVRPVEMKSYIRYLLIEPL
jgi:hypothetical protein